jgi:hypothetical protein
MATMLVLRVRLRLLCSFFKLLPGFLILLSHVEAHSFLPPMHSAGKERKPGGRKGTHTRPGVTASD